MFCKSAKYFILMTYLFSVQAISHASDDAWFGLYYSGHHNAVHDAGGDEKRLVIQGSGNGILCDYPLGRNAFFAEAITPPNGLSNPVAGQYVRGAPSNQRDTYVLSVASGCHRVLDNNAGAIMARIGGINGVVETVLRGAIDAVHEAEGLRNLRHSPASSKFVPLIEQSAMLSFLLAQHRNLRMYYGFDVVIGTLTTYIATNFFLVYGAGDLALLSAGWLKAQDQSSHFRIYTGVFTKYIFYDRSTAAAGTQETVAHIKTGLSLPISKLTLTLDYMYNPMPVVREQLIKTDNYIQMGLEYRF
jgi:hypothetical protein